MPIPPSHKPYALQNSVERAVEKFAKIEKPTDNDLAQVGVVASIQSKQDAYRSKGKEMSISELESEKHNSGQLSEFMTITGEPRPNEHCHAHAIVSGGHPESAKMRAVLAWCKMRIDDAYNGCWLPKNTAAKVKMPPHLKNAVPHSRIHRFNYYFWLDTKINMRRTGNFETLANELRLTKLMLQKSSFPSYVMLRKEQGLPK